MLSGKAISRAIRGHLLVESVLTSFVLDNIYQMQLTTNKEQDETAPTIVTTNNPQELTADISNLNLPEDLEKVKNVLEDVLD